MANVGSAPAESGRRGLFRDLTPPRRTVLAAIALLALAAASIVLFIRWRDSKLPLPPHPSVAASSTHTCALTAKGGVMCWGDNSFGQLGDGSVTGSAVPVSVRGLEAGTTALSSSGQFTCALTQDGIVRCWGANESGQLGNGTTQASSVAVDVSELGSGVLQVSAGVSHACAITASREVFCWGTNGTGELGTGDVTPSAVPVKVKDLPSRAVALDAGNGFTCVTLADASVWCWGDNGDGQLGNGDDSGRLTGEQVPNLEPVSALTAGDAHACVITRDGVVDCWGANWTGQLGIAMASRGSAFPIGVPALPSQGIQSIAGGYNATCALASGDVYCWGGAIDAASAELSGPRKTTELHGATEVSVGGFHGCARTPTGLWCWGANRNGQLGDGTTTDKPTPVLVAGL